VCRPRTRDSAMAPRACETVNDAARPGSDSPISSVGEVRHRELAVVRQQAPIVLGAHSAIAGGHEHALGAATATTEWQRHSEAPGDRRDRDAAEAVVRLAAARTVTALVNEMRSGVGAGGFECVGSQTSSVW